MGKSRPKPKPFHFRGPHGRELSTRGPSPVVVLLLRQSVHACKVQPQYPAPETFRLFQALADALLPMDAILDDDVPVVRRVVVHLDDGRELVRVHTIDDCDDSTHDDTQHPCKDGAK